MATAAVIRSDEQIQNDVLFELKWDPRIHPMRSGLPSRVESSRSWAPLILTQNIGLPRKPPAERESRGQRN
jgi:hypothetical protein